MRRLGVILTGWMRMLMWLLIYNPKAIGRAIGSRVGREIREIAEGYSWESVAGRVDEVHHEVVGGEKS